MSLEYTGIDNILGRAEIDFQEEKLTGTQSKLDKDAFLQLLVTQLTLQDPTNPFDDKELTAQLAQFSSLESLNNINESVNSILDTLDNNSILSAVKFLDTYVVAPGNEISKQDENITKIEYQLQDKSVKTYVNIFDESGNIVNTIDLGAKLPGTYTFQWDGKDFNGNDLPDGIYNVRFGAEGENGEPILISTKASGKVVGVSKENNSVMLTLEDGREVSLNDITEVTSF